MCGDGVGGGCRCGLGVGVGEFFGSLAIDVVQTRMASLFGTWIGANNALVMWKIMHWFIWGKIQWLWWFAIIMDWLWFDVTQWAIFSCFPLQSHFPPKANTTPFLPKYNLNVLAINYFNNIIIHTILFIFDLEIFVLVFLNAQKKNYPKTRAIIKTQ